MGFGAPAILIILAVVLLLFGSTRLPALAGSLGQASGEFEAGSRDSYPAPTDAIANERARPTAHLKGEPFR